VLPIVPPYLAYLAGVSFSDLQSAEMEQARARRIIFSAMAFVLGFSTVFVALGATASFVGQTIAQYFDILSIIAGIIILIMGLHFLGVFRITMLYREARVDVRNKPAGLCRRLYHGAGLCLRLDALRRTGAGGDPVHCRRGRYRFARGRAAGSLFAWHRPAIHPGSGVRQPLHRWADRFKPHMGKVEKAMGALLVLTGILFMTGQMSRIAQWLLDTFPAFATVG
jgi:cytochrome c-type biogenesis protein